MIKNWKLFLESNSRDQEILDSIKDILLPLKDSCDRIRVYIPGYVREFGKVDVNFIITRAVEYYVTFFDNSV